jgi:uncharacterized damage-inducible protein DinB
MNANEVLIEAFDRLPELIESAVDGLSAERLRWTPAPGTNSVGWLIWHLTRVQDDHIAELLGQDQVWQTGEWAVRFGLDPRSTETGYGHTPAQVAAVRPDGPDDLVEYFAAVAARTRKFLESLTDADLDRVVDERWDPPVTLGVRLVSIVNDDTQHAGQAAYLRGLQAAQPAR